MGLVYHSRVILRTTSLPKYCQDRMHATDFGKNTIFRVLLARNLNPDTDFVEV
ncbi:hypothetical protein PPTG_24005 [Phytophthora nicotianae INRA-310]|uniref:Uncharacterized protein n=2 Tax=Phytophthora nicotianae TaxID=4792 RepID=W2PP70_PHYN3|nr:hypothetical protein PPTG_24005 [Phytophthora nicotianae INRA-310]ETN01800.1 hypothetical protein PPTG_24005 [Phytophthora nicotianae INRA-310]ETO64161.1 hypothetical protein F444_18255 [Phytophthora nicotianae P1976]